MELQTTIRTHRVGAVTTGVSMIVFGVMFLLHTCFRIVSYEIIFKCWPLVLIGLGIELILSNAMDKKFIYDKGAIVLLILVAFFAMGMAGADLCFSYIEPHMM